MSDATRRWRGAALEPAAEAFKRWRARDPYPDVEPALLNTRDILAYVATTGMLDPFDPDDSASLKPATVALHLGGTFIWFDQDGVKRVKVLSEGRLFELPSNSITYVTLREHLRLPDYMAARFNLRVDLVHKGFLLGTGPMVDPGFDGTLLVPLHNLTTNPYQVKVGTRLIWIEFTKLSPLDRWVAPEPTAGNPPPAPDTLGAFVSYPPFPRSSPHDGVERALVDESGRRHPSVRSSIPEALRAARRAAEDAAQESRAAKDAAEKAKDEAEKIRQSAHDANLRVSIAAIVATVVAGALTILPILFELDGLRVGLLADSRQLLQETRLQQLELRAATPALEARLTELDTHCDAEGHCACVDP